MTESLLPMGHDRSYNYVKADSLGLKSWVEFAIEADVQDTAAFTACLRGDWAEEQVAADIAAGKRLALMGTPTVLVNNEQYAGNPRGLEEIVERKLQSANVR